ncbi:MAG: hypothetical protein ACXWQR_06105, partial [Ktedonobacterales bacterium]
MPLWPSFAQNEEKQETKKSEETAQDGKDAFREQQGIRGGIELPVPCRRGITQLELFYLSRGNWRTLAGVPSNPRVDRIVGD